MKLKTVFLKAAVISAAAMLSLTSCSFFGRGAVEGDKNVLPRTYQLDPTVAYTVSVSGINLDHPGDFQSFITVDDSLKDAVVVTTDENVWQSLKIAVEGDTVTVVGDENTKFAPSEFEIAIGVAPKKLELSGGYTVNYLLHDGTSADISSEGAANINLAADRMMTSLDIHISGAGSAALEGNAERLGVSIEGAGSIKGYSMTVGDASITMSGAGSAEVNVTGVLDVSINGTGSLTYKGSPKEVNQSIEGLGSVQPAE